MRPQIKTGKLNLADWKYISEKTGVFEKGVEEWSNKIIVDRHRELGLHFQQYLYGLLLALPPGNITVVETGVRTGVSTYFILAALNARGHNQGHLWSCDPMYRGQGQVQNRFREYGYFPYWRDKDVYFDNWTFIAEKSVKALPDIVEIDSRLWDVFIHDSDHSVANMVFELNFAWEHLKPGGFLIVDDPHGDHVVGQHKAFEEWVTKMGLDWGMLGSAAVVEKPGGLITGMTTKAAMVADEARPSLPGLPPESLTTAQMEAAVAAAVAKAPPAPAAVEAEKADDENLDDLAPSKKGFSDDDLDELDDKE